MIPIADLAVLQSSVTMLSSFINITKAKRFVDNVVTVKDSMEIFGHPILAPVKQLLANRDAIIDCYVQHSEAFSGESPVCKLLQLLGELIEQVQAHDDRHVTDPLLDTYAILRYPLTIHCLICTPLEGVKLCCHLSTTTSSLTMGTVGPESSLKKNAILLRNFHPFKDV